MGEPNVNYNSKSKRETIRETKREEELRTRRSERKTEGGCDEERDGSGKERDEICQRREESYPPVISII